MMFLNELLFYRIERISDWYLRSKGKHIKAIKSTHFRIYSQNNILLHIQDEFMNFWDDDRLKKAFLHLHSL